MKISFSDFIDDELAMRQWSPSKMINAMRISDKIYGALCKNEIPMTSEIAWSFTSIFGKTKEYWQRLYFLCSRISEISALEK